MEAGRKMSAEIVFSRYWMAFVKVIVVQCWNLYIVYTMHHLVQRPTKAASRHHAAHSLDGIVLIAKLILTISIGNILVANILLQTCKENKKKERLYDAIFDGEW
jgi:hypothetical protein